MSTFPTYVAAGTYTTGTGALSIPAPAGIAEGDLLVLFVESENQDISTPSGWTQIGTAQGTGTAGNATSARLEVFYKYTTGTESNVSVADSGDHTSARMLAFRGVQPAAGGGPLTGTPAGGVVASASTAVSVAGITTSHNNALMVYAWAGSQDTTTSQSSGQANASLTNVTERTDNQTTNGDGGGITVVTGELATAGASGTMTATLANSSVQGYLCFGLRAVTDHIVTGGAGSFSLTGQTVRGKRDWQFVDNLLYSFEDLSTATSDFFPTLTPVGAGGTVTRNTTGATLDTYSWEFNPTGSSAGQITVSTGLVLDLTDYRFIKLDVDYYGDGSQQGFYLTVYDGTYSETMIAVSSGTMILSLDTALANNPSMNLAACGLQITYVTTGAGSSASSYVDNLRAEYPQPGLAAETGAFSLTGQTANLIPPPADQQFENFEANTGAGPINLGLKTWSVLFGTYTQTTNNVTEGTYSGNMTAAGGSGAYLSIDPVIPADTFTGYDRLELDVTINTIGTDPDDKVWLYLTDGTNIAYVNSHTSGTLSLVFADFPSLDLSLDINLYIIGGYDNAGAPEVLVDAIDFDFDNLYLYLNEAGYAIDGEAGAFTLTGQDALFNRTYVNTAEAGAFTLTGQAALLEADLKITADAASFTLTGEDATLNKGNTLGAEAGAFTLTGQATNFSWTHILTASPASFGLTGVDSTLALVKRIFADVGTFNLTGLDAALSRIRLLESDVGAFTLTGQAAGVSAVRTMAADAGSIVVSGQAAQGNIGRKITADSGSFAFSGQSLNLVRSYAVPFETFTLTSYIPTFIGERVVNKVTIPSTETFTLTSYEPLVASGASIGVPLKTFTMTSGASYYSIQLVTCTGEPAPLQHIEDSKKLTADAYIDLFEIVLAGGGTKLYLKMNHSVDWQGNTYEGTGIKIEGVGTYADDEVARPKLTIFNPENVFSYLVDQGLLENAKVVRIRVLKEHIDDDLPIYRRQQWFVKRVASVRRGFIGLELRDMLDGQNFLTPGRMFIPPEFPMVSLQ